MAITLSYESSVRATPEQVWAKFSDITCWPRFNKAIAGVRWLDGEPWHRGAKLAMDLVQPRPMTVESVLDEVVAPNLLRLKGKMMGVSAEHTFEFTAQPDGTTKMRTEQVLTGAATIFISEKMKSAATSAFANWFDGMRREIESV